ncbi:MAG: hypothetical protein U1E50_10505 [Caulobacteraceae bacterium]
MKTAALTGVLLVLAPTAALAAPDRCDFAAWGTNVTVRAQDGVIIGNIYTSGGGTTTFRDASGSILGSSTTSDTGRTTFRDDNGSILGTRDVTAAGNVVYRDANGSIVDEVPAPLSRFCKDN